MRISTIFIFLFFITIPIVSAFDADITIETNRPEIGLVVRILDPATLSIIDTVYAQTEPTGMAKASYTTSHSEIAFKVMIIRNGEIIEEETFEGPYTSTEIFLSMINKSKTQSETVDTDSTDTNTESNTTNEEELEENSEISSEGNGSDSGITGNAINLEGNVWKNSTYYLLAAVLIAGIVGFFLIKKFSPERTPKDTFSQKIEPKAFQPKSAQPQSQQAIMVKNEDIHQEPDIDRMEQRIMELQSEIKNLKKKERISDAERRFEEARKELERLKDENKK